VIPPSGETLFHVRGQLTLRPAALFQAHAARPDVAPVEESYRGWLRQHIEDEQLVEALIGLGFVVRLADPIGDLAGLRKYFAEVGDQDLGQARYGHRHVAHRGRNPLATQIPANGNFWHDLAGPFFVAGVGTAFTFIPTSIGALAGVTERDGGVASGLLNTSQQAAVPVAFLLIRRVNVAKGVASTPPELALVASVE